MVNSSNKSDNVSLDDIKQYIKLKESMTLKEIYEKHYSQKYNTAFETFKKKFYNWNKKIKYDNELLEAANLAYKFNPTKSTVQINKDGEIIQAWIKQNKNIDDYVEEIICAIKEYVTPMQYNVDEISQVENRMLEIPLADMHFGLCNYDYYKATKDRLMNIVVSHKWDEIHLIIGQDLFHNDDFEGRTTKGTLIEKINMKQAWNDAKRFYCDIISACTLQSKNVFIHYSKGNHDKSIGWTFVQLLKAIFPKLNYDDSLKSRKCIHWNGCFIGFGHCDYKKSRENDLFKQFVLDYPVEYSNSSVREIHCGHLHHETGKDEGIMIRRLPTGNKTDEWSDDNGHVGAHKRFMIFEYEPNFLATINYI